MTVGTTTGAVRAGAKQAFAVGVLEVSMPKTATAVAGAATLNQGAGFVTSQPLTTAAAATATFTITNSFIVATDMIFASVNLGTATTGVPAVATCSAGAGVCTIVVQNIGAVAFNGTIIIGFLVVKQAPVSL